MVIYQNIEDMLYNIVRRFKTFRKYIGGHWVKTKERGWISYKTYSLYLTYKFDPEWIEEEIYEKNNMPS